MTPQLLVNIDVDDLERAVEFYTAGLGLQFRRSLFDGSVAELAGAGFTIHLLEKTRGTPATPDDKTSRTYERHWTPVHLDFQVTNVVIAVERAVRAGATLEGEIKSFSWGHLATMSDPFGHGFCLVQMSVRGYDEAA